MNKKREYYKSIIILVVGCAVLVGTLVAYYVSKNVVAEETLESITSKMYEAIDEYSLLDVTLMSNVPILEKALTTDSEFVATIKYQIDKDYSVGSYQYTDTLHGESNAYWESNSDSTYDIYLNDFERKAWVKVQSESQPIVVEGWDFDDLIKVSTLDPDLYFHNDIACYVIYSNVVPDGNVHYYQELYIDSNTYLPVYMTVYNAVTNTVESVSVNSLEELENMEPIEPSYIEEFATTYDLKYSNKNVPLYEKPAIYLTEEEYFTILESEVGAE